ncbi:unnamed protein product [Brassica napus]|uniref:(rape) hypothetical protein n=1 Tax=Brassica napus TaxID=3708 RepID=A0A817BCZ3_BRANA|nr:unnamed protein product [Brassica napus]
MWDQRPSFRFEIDNFSDKKAVITSKDFVAGGCEWYLAVHPKGNYNDQLCLFLYVANLESLRTGWKRSAKYYFLVLNDSNKELYKSSSKNKLFCAENPARGTRKTLPLSKFQEKGFLEKDKLIIEVYINVVEAFDGEGEDITGFAAHVSQKRIYCRFQKLEESVKNLELMELGLKLDSLKSKLEEVSLEKKKSHDADESRAKLLEGRVKNIELMNTASKLHSLKLKLEEIALERKKSYDADESRVRQLEERIKNIELMDLGFKLDCVNTKLDNADESRVQQFEERFKDMSMNVGFTLNCLNTKIEEVSLERKESDDVRFQQLEESVNNIELMVSSLEDELDKKKDKPSNDGFWLVD